MLIWTSEQEEYPQTLKSLPKASPPITNQPATNLPVLNRMLIGNNVDETVDGISNETTSEASNLKGKINTKCINKFW